MLKIPFLLVCVVLVIPVGSCTTAIVAPVIAIPFSSLTVPLIVLAVSCAKAAVVKKIMVNNTDRNFFVFMLLILSKKTTSILPQDEPKVTELLRLCYENVMCIIKTGIEAGM